MAYDIHIVFDCHDVDRVSRFWLAALEGYNYPGSPLDQPPGSPPEGFDSWAAFADANGIPEDQRYAVRTIIDTVGGRPDIFFIAVPEDKAVKNRLHLDIKVSRGLPADQVRMRQDAEAERLVAAGAKVLTRVPDGVIVMQDVEGNEFCIA
ncbi:VOC family protein [Actinopolymorpha sp. NPDC004070]|uniref:VOC family protein n=1 Tax=Actinopolymorpha sp. NPDC004070 TaxID=3154548 RepID=UPI0033AA1BB5